MTAPSSSDMKPLLRAWGVNYDSSKVVLDRALAQAVQTSSDQRNPVERYPMWLHLDNSDFDSSDQVTANLQALNLASVGALFPLKGATTTFQPLVRSSNEASLMDAMQAHLNPRPGDLMSAVEPTGQRYTIAARNLRPGKDCVSRRTANDDACRNRAGKTRPAHSGFEPAQTVEGIDQRHCHGGQRYFRRPLLGSRRIALRPAPWQRHSRTTLPSSSMRSRIFQGPMT